MLISNFSSLKLVATLALFTAFGTAFARGQEVVNVYSARHYDTDDSIYEEFTSKTGIKVNLISGGSDALIERLQREGKRSPADIFVTVDAGRLFQAEEKGIFQPIESSFLKQQIPANLRHPDGLWFGLTKRARIILRSKDRTKEGDIQNYEDLADPKWKGKVLIRSSTNVYNQSLVGSIIEAKGKSGAEAWCKGVVANMARPPQGGDRDQIKGVAAGEGDIAVANSYYYARMLSGTDEEREAASKVEVVFPNQENRGTHVNLSGIGVVKSAPNKANAIKFIEFLASDWAQGLFAKGNNEYPIAPRAETIPVLRGFGEFTEDKVNAAKFGKNNTEAIRMMDRAGWR